LGIKEKADSLVVTWISGKMQTIEQVKADQSLTLFEKDAKLRAVPVKPNKSWFTEVHAGIDYKDPPSDINDFNRQPLLISEFSYSGPCMAKYDFNKDGLEDLIIGGTPGHAATLFIQQKSGLFSTKKIPAFEKDSSYVDAAIAVFDANGDGYADIYVASGGYHHFSPNDSLLNDRLYINDGKNNFHRSNDLPAINGSKSCVKVQDINGDGFPDIFVGCRVVPGRYPEIPGSYILINDGKGKFTDKTVSVCPDLSRCGMITDAVWADLDGDKKNELLVVGEWMPVTVFRNENGKLVNRTDRFFDRRYTGWWNKIATGDFNGDGKPDIVIGNMGLNTQFKASEKEPLELYYKDFDNNGSIDPMFSFYIQHQRYPYITRDELVTQLPFMRKRFSNFKSYADITMDDLFQNNELNGAGHLSAERMNTTCFLSTSTGRFTIAELPVEVQYSPVYTIDTLDFNDDGKTDLLLCGNNSHTKIRLGKFDANYGVLIAGDGKGNFKYIPQTESGFNIRGDARSSVRVGNKIFFGINSNRLSAYILSP
jgi:hypothetical protein